MLIYLLRRLVLMVPTLIGITVVVFAVMAMSPGGISAQNLVQGLDMNPAEKEALLAYYNKRYGLDQPAPMQYLRWLNNISPIGFDTDENGRIGQFVGFKWPDLGDSLQYGRPVSDLLAERIPITLLLNVLTVPLIYLLAITIGVKAATQRGSQFDVGSGVALLALWSIPTMLAGVLLLGFYASVQHWQWFPTAGLHSRSAQEMPFMPHWGSAVEVFWFATCVLLGMAVALILARWPNKQFRQIIAAVMGAILGVYIALAHGQGGMILKIVVAAVVSMKLAWVANWDSERLRSMVLIFLGIGVGAVFGVTQFGHGFVAGYLLDGIWHLVLPVICLAYGGFAALTKLTRTSVLENLHADYARTALAKGLPQSEVLWRHVFRNSLLPLVTVAAGLLPSLLSGSLIVEYIFSLQGMGQLAVEAVQGRDRELMLSITYLSGILTLVGYLLADIGYAVLDPRVSYD